MTTEPTTPELTELDDYLATRQIREDFYRSRRPADLPELTFAAAGNLGWLHKFSDEMGRACLERLSELRQDLHLTYVTWHLGLNVARGVRDALMYGRRVSDAVWREVMQEVKFAHLAGEHVNGHFMPLDELEQVARDLYTIVVADLNKDEAAWPPPPPATMYAHLMAAAVALSAAATDLNED